jgi:fucose 4-O-acetylase-like acetyltransferase
MSEQRVAWVDALRGMGIVSVMLCHNQIEPAPFKFLKLILVPVFFFASGLVFNPGKYDSYRAFVRRRFRALIVPYLFYSGVAWVFWLLVGLWSNFHLHTPQPAIGLTLAMALIGVPYGIAPLMPYNIPLWFLTCLFSADSVLFLLQRRVKTPGKLLFWMAALSVVGFLYGANPRDLRLPWNFDTALSVVFYYGAGYLFRRRFGLSLTWPWWGKLPIAAAFLALSVYLSTFNPQTYLFLNQLGSWPWFHATSLTCIVAFVLIAQLIAPTRLFSYLGRNSLPLLGLHVMGIVVFRTIVGAATPIAFDQNVATTMWSSYWTAGAILVVMPFIEIMNKHAPWTVGRPKPKTPAGPPAAATGGDADPSGAV